jgi:antitoxin (DNA-binding transcriptional repressor) of toxin-antitoxin stability system
MNGNTITIDDISRHLLTMTELRRRPGEVLRRLPEVGTYFLSKDGRLIAQIIPLQGASDVSTNKKAAVAKLYSLAGGFRSKKSLSPSQLNKFYDQQYEEMLH